MSIRLTLWFALSLGVVGFISAAWIVRPAWMVAHNLDWWNHDQYERQLRENEERSNDLELQDERARMRIARKDQCLDDLLAHRRTLLETAAWFRHLDRTLADFPSVMPTYFSNCSEEEAYCRQVMEWTQTRSVEWTPSQTEQVMCQLGSELNQLLTAHNGHIELPEIQDGE